MMERRLEITYYQHSGFTCAMDDVLLVFDYWRGEEPNVLPEEAGLKEETLRAYRQVVVFVSHSHPDHLDEVIWSWQRLGNVTYVVSYELPPACTGLRMRPGDALQLSEKLAVRAYDSTDLGISFVVELGGFTIFHAGDLNLWHWREESTLKEIEKAEEDFHRVCASMTREKIDVAFFPVDPRQGRLYDAGANYFMLCLKPRLMIPMHFWNRTEVAVEFAKRSRCHQTECVAMTRPGQKLLLELAEDGFMTIHVLAAPKPMPEQSPEGINRVSLAGYEGEDPFINTDLPVKLDE